LDVLNRQLALRKRLELAGKIDHGYLFFKETGEPICNLQYPYRRWRWTMARNNAGRQDIARQIKPTTSRRATSEIYVVGAKISAQFGGYTDAAVEGTSKSALIIRWCQTSPFGP
jgi:hypothetical protein